MTVLIYVVVGWVVDICAIVVPAGYMFILPVSSRPEISGATSVPGIGIG